MKTTKKDECSYSVSNAIRTLAMVPVVGLEPTRGISPTDFEFYRLRGNEWTVIPYGGP